MIALRPHGMGGICDVCFCERYVGRGVPTPLVLIGCV